MNLLKRCLGLVWIIAGPALIFFLVKGAIDNIDTNGTKDINNPVIWIIIIAIFTPIAIGLTIFGWYAWKAEYSELPQDSSQVLSRYPSTKLRDHPSTSSGTKPQ